MCEGGSGREAPHVPGPGPASVTALRNRPKMHGIINKIDAKTKLQELSLKKFKKLPIYKIISNTGPRHKPLFKVGVKLVNTKLFIAEGKSKKDAEQNAAFLCLRNIK